MQYNSLLAPLFVFFICSSFIVTNSLFEETASVSIGPTSFHQQPPELTSGWVCASRRLSRMFFLGGSLSSCLITALKREGFLIQRVKKKFEGFEPEPACWYPDWGSERSSSIRNTWASDEVLWSKFKPLRTRRYQEILFQNSTPSHTGLTALMKYFTRTSLTLIRRMKSSSCAVAFHTHLLLEKSLFLLNWW